MPTRTVTDPRPAPPTAPTAEFETSERRAFLSWQRQLGLLLGWVLLSLPLIAFLGSRHEAAQMAAERRTEAIRARHDTLLGRLRQPDVARHLTEVRLQRLADGCAAHLAHADLQPPPTATATRTGGGEATDRPAPASAPTPTTAAVAELIGLAGIDLDLVIVLAASGSAWRTVHASGSDPEQLRLLGGLLRDLAPVAAAIDRTDPALAPGPLTPQRLLDAFGVAFDVDSAVSVLRGRCVPVRTRAVTPGPRTRPGFPEPGRGSPEVMPAPCGSASRQLFWQLLFRPDDGSLAGATRPPEPVIVGAFMALLPAADRGDPTNAIVRAFAEPDTELTLTPEGQALTRHSRNRHLAIDQGWLITTATVQLARPTAVRLATRLPPAESTLPDRLAAGAAVLFCVAMGAVWTAAVWRDRGPAASLVGQFWWGFLLAILLPGSFLWWVGEDFAARQLDVAELTARTALRRRLDVIQSRFVARRNREIAAIRDGLRQPELVRLIERVRAGGTRTASAGGSPDPEAIAALQRGLRRLMARLRRQDSIDLSSIAMVAGDDLTLVEHKLPNDDPTAIGHGLRDFAIDLLGEAHRDPATPGGTPTGNATDPDHPGTGDAISGAVQAELAGEVLARILTGIVGPAGLLDFAHGQGLPLAVNVGVGHSTMVHFTVPDDRSPRAIGFAIFPNRRSDRRTLRAILRRARQSAATDHDHPPLVFAVERERWGTETYPRIGMAWPMLREVIRELRQLDAPLHQRRGDGDDEWLVEGVPEYPRHQFMLVGLQRTRPLLAQVNRMQHGLRVFLLLAVGGSLALGAAVAGDILRPVQALTFGMGRVRRGDLAVRLREARADELGDLCRAFDRMTVDLAQGRLLSRMVSDQARADVMATLEGRRIAGFRAPATVVYLAALGSTESLDRVAAETWVARLDRQVRELTVILGRHQLMIDKLIGDRLLAYRIDDPASAGSRSLETPSPATMPPIVGVAPDMPTGRADESTGQPQDLPSALLAAWHEGRLPYEPVVGMAHGPVMVGFLGTGQRRDHTVIGDTVNLAARCAALAASLDTPRMVVTAEAAQRLGIGDETGPTRLRPLGTDRVKGKTESVHLLQIVGDRPTGVR